MKEPTIEEACAIIIEWPDQDDFICWNVQHFMYEGEADDNSIELSEYWIKCKKLINQKR